MTTIYRVECKNELGQWSPYLYADDFEDRAAAYRLQLVLEARWPSQEFRIVPVPRTTSQWMAHIDSYQGGAM